MGGWVDGWMGGWVDGWEYRFSSLMKQNKKAKICFVIYSAGIFFLKNLCYEVFAKQKKTEEPSKYYFDGFPPMRFHFK